MGGKRLVAARDSGRWMVTDGGRREVVGGGRAGKRQWRAAIGGCSRIVGRDGRRVGDWIVA